MLIMEYLSLGSLRDSGEKTRICMAEAIQCFAQCLDALDYLQKLGITHRDIKPENILVSYRATGGTNIRTKLADFGLAKNGFDLHSQKGTLPYAAPQMSHGEARRIKYPPYIADTWSLAVVFIEYYKGVDILRHYQIHDSPEKSHASWCDKVHEIIRGLIACQPEDSFLQIADVMLALKKEVRLNAGAVIERFRSCSALREALHRVRSEPSPNEEPPCWDNDPEPQEGLTAPQQLHVVLEGFSESGSLANRSEESLSQWKGSLFKTVSAFKRVQQPQICASSSQTTIKQACTQIPNGSVGGSNAKTPRHFSLHATACKEVHKPSERSILAPVRQGSRYSVDKSHLKDRYSGPIPHTREVKPEFRSLQLGIERV